MGRRAVWLGLLLLAQTAVLAERLPIQTFTTRNGLRSNTILKLTKDSRGFIWFSTRDGLSRFDGYRFVNYSTEDGLPVPTINHFLESSRGVYWVATNGGGVCRFDPRPSTSATAAGTRRMHRRGWRSFRRSSPTRSSNAPPIPRPAPSR